MDYKLRLLNFPHKYYSPEESTVTHVLKLYFKYMNMKSEFVVYYASTQKLKSSLFKRNLYEYKLYIGKVCLSTIYSHTNELISMTFSYTVRSCSNLGDLVVSFWVSRTITQSLAPSSSYWLLERAD